MFLVVFVLVRVLFEVLGTAVACLFKLFMWSLLVVLVLAVAALALALLTGALGLLRVLAEGLFELCVHLHVPLGVAILTWLTWRILRAMHRVTG